MRCKGSDKEMHHMVWTLLHKDIFNICILPENIKFTLLDCLAACVNINCYFID